MGTPLEIVLAAVLGLVAGCIAALVHLRTSWGSVQRIAPGAAPPRMMPGALGRIIGSALVLAALALVHTAAFAGGLVAFFVVERIGLRRMAQREEPWIRSS